MRFLVDESVRRSVVDFLINEGHDVVYVSDATPSVRDEDILRFSVTERRVLITNDRDFGELVFYRRLSAFGVVLFRLKNETRETVLAGMKILLDDYANRLVGAFIIVSDRQIRIRPTS